MGCGQSSDKGSNGVKTPTPRRRLSVGHVDATGGGAEDGASQEDNRGMISALNEQNIMEMLAATDEGLGGRKFSIGSQTDQAKTSFANKSIEAVGDKVDPAAQGIGYTCRKGLKPESPNQDSWMVLKTEGTRLYGVFDGHGQKGHDVSNFVKDNLPKLIIKDQRFRTDDQHAMFMDAFKRMQGLINTADRMKKLSASMSGTTCTICAHDLNRRRITVAHVADSTCVLGSMKNGKIAGAAITRDHKPDLKDERARIEKAGGRVIFDGYANHRVYAKNGRYPGLNMSRCLGDLWGHAEAGCSCEPEVKTLDLTDDDKLLLLCSDGVWEFIDPNEGVEMAVKDNLHKSEPMTAAEKLAKLAWDRWIREEGGQVVDDITVVLVDLEKATADAKPAAAADEEPAA